MKRRDEGFTLIELLVSIGIMGLVVAFSFLILTEAHQMSQEARYRLLAANAARSTLEEIKSQPLAAVPSINTAAYVPTELPNANIQIVTNPANLSGQSIATVTVIVTWVNPKGVPGRLEISTMRWRF